MRNPAEREKKDIVLQQCFECLTEKGIESITIKDFSTATGMAMSSIYYWFEDKDEIVLDAVEWGLTEYVKTVFDYAFEHTDDLMQLCQGIKVLAQKNKKAFRLIFQVATSPQYGEHIRSLAEKLENTYRRYTEVLSEKLNVPFDILFPYVNIIVSAFVDCVIWEDWIKFEMEVNCVINRIEQENAYEK